VFDGQTLSRELDDFSIIEDPAVAGRDVLRTGNGGSCEKKNQRSDVAHKQCGPSA
jgi:hypothetical protein